VAIGENEAAGIRKKPAPDTVFEALRQLNDISLTSHHSPLTSDLAVYVGDSDVDLETANNSGLPCISVLWGFRDRDFLIQHGAKTFISAPSELL
jgi:phosphoglycolate phosphatase